MWHCFASSLPQAYPSVLVAIFPERENNPFWYGIRNLPDALLIEILARLPVKSIFLFKSVCKHWQTLISHPSFCRFYYSILNSNAASSRPFRILQKYTHLPNFREFSNRLGPEIHSCSEFSVLFLSSREDERHRYDQFRILDTSNGLILYRSGGWSLSTPFVYYICDPLTRQSITLPTREDRCRHFLVEGLITRVNDDHMLIGYTVVRVELVESQSNYVNLEMFSSETGEWIGYKLPPTIPMRLEEEVGGAIHCCGALHWRVRNYDNGIHGLLAFDPYKDPKSVRLIALPHDRDLQSEKRNLGMRQLCGESQGTLRYFEVAYNKDYVFTMWVMKDYEKGEWCCEFKVRRSDLHSNHPELSNWLLDGRWFSPLSFHLLNPNVVYLTCMNPECVVAYDVLNRRLDVASKPLDECICWGMTVPYILPRWPVLVSVKETQVSISKESSSKLLKNMTY